MGDDTFGQCGQDDTNKKHPSTIYGKQTQEYPVKVMNLSYNKKHLKNITKITAGGNHNPGT